MKRTFLVFAVLAVASFALAQRIDDTNGKHTQLYPTKDKAPGWAKPGGAGGQNLTNHGGPVIQSAKVVSIFWGPSWGSGGTLGGLASEIMGFFSQFGSTGEYKVITQYSGIQATNLTNQFWWDTSAAPTNVSDSNVEAEVVRSFSHVGIDANTVYEVFLPAGSYASYGSSTSCGGPNLQFCAYHSNFNYNGTDIKYASNDFEHFACHETREAVTDPDGNAWFDRRGYEADDKCAWSPAPFLGTGGYGYQWEWSNAVSGCVKTAP